MIAIVNQHRKDVTYHVGDKVWLSTKNLKTDRPSKKLDDKQIGPYPIIGVKGHAYKLDLFLTMRIHDVFNPKILRKDPNDPLPRQNNPPIDPVIVNGENEWEVEQVLGAKRIYKRLMYKVKWMDCEPDSAWYYADEGEFDNAQEPLTEFYMRYPYALGGPQEPPRRPRGRPRKLN